MQEENIKSNVDVSTILLISFVFVIFITNIGIATIQGFVKNWYEIKTITVIITCFHILRTVSYLLPAFAIKNKTYKIIGIILSSIMVAYMVCSPIMTMLQH